MHQLVRCCFSAYTSFSNLLCFLRSSKVVHSSCSIMLLTDGTWDISTICSNANNTISFLKRNINISNKSIKEKAYMSLVRPTLEYASSVWDSYQQNDIHRLEMVQRRAARYVTNRYHNTSSVSSMIEQLEWTTLQHLHLMILWPMQHVTFTSLSLVLLWQLFYLFCSNIVINTVIVTAGNFEP
jgi:hypothetical protein